jgi:superfamily II DNA/RNA helicase
MRCPHRGKIDFVKKIYDSISLKTQTIIFVNFREFAVKVFDTLRSEGYKVSLIMGGDMGKEERDK